MANALYELTKGKMLSGGVDLTTSNVKVILVDTGDYTFNQSHEFLSSVPALARVATSGNMTSKSTTGGVFDAADVTFESVSGDTASAVIIYIDSGTESTSPLIAYLDSDFTGLPVTPNGGNITIQWNASGIFKL